jgi:hypothetical protein
MRVEFAWPEPHAKLEPAQACLGSLWEPAVNVRWTRQVTPVVSTPLLPFNLDVSGAYQSIRPCTRIALSEHMPAPLSRRLMLQGLGTSISLPLLASMMPSGAAAQQVLRAKRLVWMFQPTGSLSEHFPNPGALTATSLSDMLQPFARHVSRMTVIRNLRNAMRDAGEHASLGPHDASAPHLLTGMPVTTSAGRAPTAADFMGDILPNGTAGGPSIDQVIAARAPFASNRFPSVQIGHSCQDIAGRPLIRNISFRAINQPLLHENNARTVFNRLFGNGLPTTMPMPQPTDPRGNLVANAVVEEYRALRSQLGQADRQRLEAHLTELEALRRTADASVMPPPPPSANCMAPMLQMGADTDTTFSSTQAQYEAKTKAQMDNIVMAFRCDLTRVVTFMWGSGMGSATFNWLSPDLPRVNSMYFHVLGHDLGALPGETSNCGGTQCGVGPADAREHYRRVQKQLFSSIAYLLDQLQASTLPDGSTLLDETVVVWSPELARGATHELSRMNHLLFGNVGTFFRKGVCVDAGNASHTRLLTSVGQAFGLTDASGNPISHYGSPNLPAAQRAALTAVHA